MMTGVFRMTCTMPCDTLQSVGCSLTVIKFPVFSTVTAFIKWKGLRMFEDVSVVKSRSRRALERLTSRARLKLFSASPRLILFEARLAKESLVSQACCISLSQRAIQGPPN